MMALPPLASCAEAYHKAFVNPFDPSEGERCSLTDTIKVAEVERILGERLPDSMRMVVSSYDFSHFSAGQVMFEHGDDYHELIDRNQAVDVAWWGGGPRPHGRLLVAETTGWAAMIDCGTGRVLAFESGSAWTESVEVASNFDVFLRLALLIAVDAAWASVVDELQGADSPGRRFWTALAAGTS